MHQINIYFTQNTLKQRKMLFKNPSFQKEMQKKLQNKLKMY